MPIDLFVIGAQHNYERRQVAMFYRHFKCLYGEIYYCNTVQGLCHIIGDALFKKYYQMISLCIAQILSTEYNFKLSYIKYPNKLLIKKPLKISCFILSDENGLKWHKQTKEYIGICF